MDSPATWEGVHWKDSRPKDAPQSHPFMALEWGNSADRTNRRLHLRGFYRYHGVDGRYEAVFKHFTSAVCQAVFAQRGRHTIPEKTFDFLVDRNVWRRLFNGFDVSNRPKWPFTNVIDLSQEAGAPSSIYRDFVAKEDEKRKSQPAKASTAATASDFVTAATATPASTAEACSVGSGQHEPKQGNTGLNDAQDPASKAPNAHQSPAQASRKRIATSTENAPVPARATKRLRPSDTPGQTATGQQNAARSKKCIHCKATLHDLKECPWPAKNGILPGCPMCHSMGHNITNCSKWSGLSLEDKYRFLVLNRGNMPPLATRDPQLWYKVLQEYLQMSPNHQPPNAFPWTPGFGRQVYKWTGARMDTISAWSEYKNRFLLPIDGNTKDWFSVRQHFDGVRDGGV